MQWFKCQAGPCCGLLCVGRLLADATGFEVPPDDSVGQFGIGDNFVCDLTISLLKMKPR